MRFASPVLLLVSPDEFNLNQIVNPHLAPAVPAFAARESGLGRALKNFGELVDRQIPDNLRTDPENARRGRLIARFGALGLIFGLTYAAFYLVIGHKWGAAIILLCTVGVALTPLLMLWRKSIEPAAHFFSLVLTLGFLGLCLVEGGVHGHAIAWLVSVPLCALLLLGTRGALIWAGIVFLSASLVVGLNLAGIELPLTYDPKWSPVISAAGYLGLIAFMFILGLIFENGRARAHAHLMEALAELAASNERLVYLNKEKSEFLGIAAHDLKNPLTVILANGGLLKVIREQAQVASMAEMIIRAAERMRQLITNLLDVNAIEEGQFASRLERYDLGKLVREIVEQNMPAANQKKIGIQTDISDDLFVRTDHAAAAQILDNLISNALKYSPHNRTVHIRTLTERDRALVQVRDEGPGISREDQKKLFQKYSRLSARPTGGESSTGLGLAIAKRLAEALSGGIQCQSALGAGATFTLSLPLWPEATEPMVGVAWGHAQREGG
jgi:signal transduction histidine kinase